MDIYEKAKQACTGITRVLVNNKNGGPFAAPVDYLALNIPDYPHIIKKPMDLGTIQKKMSSNEYTTVDEWTADVRLVFANATTFNPPDHIVHQMAKTLSGVFDKKLAALLEKLETRSFVDDGRGATMGAAGMGEWPRKAKQILKSTMEHAQAFPFNEAVDWKKLNIPDYPKIIKKPMDLGKIEKRLAQGHYNAVDEFASDVRLVFTNAKTYNVEFSDIHQMAKVVEAHFDEKFSASFKGKNKRAAPADAKQGSSKKSKKEDSDDEMSDVSHELPEEPTADEKARPVTLEEKREFNEKVRDLKSDDLGKMVDIIKDRCPKSIDQTKDDEIEIDVDALDSGDFRYVAKFVSMCTNTPA